MTDEYLANLIRCVGVVVALVASFLAAPAATRELAQRAALKGRAGWTVVRTQATRVKVWLTGRNRGAVVAVLPAMVSISASGVVVSAGSSWDVNADDDLPARVSRLEARVDELKRSSDENRQAITAEADERHKADERLSQRITDEVTAIREDIRSTEEETRRLDAAVLPALGVGVVLSGIPDLLAVSVNMAVVSIITGLTFLQWALVHFWKTGPAGSAAP